MKIYFPDFYTEAHRLAEHSGGLVKALKKEGVICYARPTEVADPDAIFCGSIYCAEKVRKERESFPHLRDVPVIHYNWDIYPWQVELNPELWRPYLLDLKKAKEVWVPSACTVERTKEFAGVGAHVIKTSVHPWEKPKGFKPSAVPYVVDVMRKYPDRNRNAVAEACKKLGVMCVETGCTMPWEEFKRTIYDARLLVSAYEEASTGGLTLLEGYWHGVPVLLSNSPRNGAFDYFGDRRADYFQWDDSDNLYTAISLALLANQRPNVTEARDWIVAEYSEQAFARRIANRLKEIL